MMAMLKQVVDHVVYHVYDHVVDHVIDQLFSTGRAILEPFLRKDGGVIDSATYIRILRRNHENY